MDVSPARSMPAAPTAPRAAAAPREAEAAAGGMAMGGMGMSSKAMAAMGIVALLQGVLSISGGESSGGMGAGGGAGSTRGHVSTDSSSSTAAAGDAWDRIAGDVVDGVSLLAHGHPVQAVGTAAGSVRDLVGVAGTVMNALMMPMMMGGMGMMRRH